MFDSQRAGRRRFLLGGGAALGSSLVGLHAVLHARQPPAAVAADSARPSASWGLQIGDVRADRAIVWSRADRPARMLVEWSLDERMRNAVAVRGPHALDGSDFASRVDLAGLPADREVFVRTTYLDLDRGRARSEPVVGRLRTAPGPDAARNVRFVWGGDTAGQGWGINLEIGGMRLYETMRQLRPDFFIHCGDTIYADGPMVERPQTPDGSPWVNAFLDAVPEKRKVAETQLEFHRNYLYNLHDANVRRFNACGACLPGLCAAAPARR
jgi:alkaline phosphatase D